MRIPVSHELLAELVAEQLRGCVTSEAEFTAYDITRVLRMEQPHLEISHAEVRAWVHSYMASVLCSGLYTYSCRQFLGGVAIVYQPTQVLSLPVLPAPLLPVSLN